MKEEKFREALLKRIDVLIALALERGEEGSTSTTAKIQRLAGFGLAPGEIGSILGKEANYVSAVLSQVKKRNSKTASRRTRD